MDHGTKRVHGIWQVGTRRDEPKNHEITKECLFEARSAHKNHNQAGQSHFRTLCEYNIYALTWCFMCIYSVFPNVAIRRCYTMIKALKPSRIYCSIWMMILSMVNMERLVNNIATIHRKLYLLSHIDYALPSL